MQEKKSNINERIKLRLREVMEQASMKIKLPANKQALNPLKTDFTPI